MTRPTQIRFRRPPGYARNDERRRYLMAKIALIESEMAALVHEQIAARTELNNLGGPVSTETK